MVQGERVLVKDFQEDPFLTEDFQRNKDLLKSLQTTVDTRITGHVSVNNLKGYRILVIRTVLNKDRVAICLLVLSTIALFTGIVVGVTFPHADIGSIASTATIALACLLQACIAWCQR